MSLKNKLDLQSSIGFVIKLTEKMLVRTLDLEMKAQCDLTEGQWKVIAALGLSDGLNQKELAEMIFVETPTLVPILDKMEKEGLVVRISNESDRRTNLVFLTEKSKKMTAKIVDCILNFRKSITKGIPEKDLIVARSVLEIISHNAEQLAKTKHNITLKNPHNKMYKD